MLSTYDARLSGPVRHNTSTPSANLFPLVLDLTIATDERTIIAYTRLVSINVVSLHRARLVLGWVTVCGRVNHLGV